MVYYRADRIVDGVGTDHPDLSGNTDKYTIISMQKRIAVLIASITNDIMPIGLAAAINRQLMD